MKWWAALREYVSNTEYSWPKYFKASFNSFSSVPSSLTSFRVTSHALNACRSEIGWLRRRSAWIKDRWPQVPGSRCFWKPIRFFKVTPSCEWKLFSEFLYRERGPKYGTQKGTLKKETQPSGNPVDINCPGVLRHSHRPIQEPTVFIFPIRFFGIFLISSSRSLLGFYF